MKVNNYLGIYKMKMSYILCVLSLTFNTYALQVGENVSVQYTAGSFKYGQLNLTTPSSQASFDGLIENYAGIIGTGILENKLELINYATFQPVNDPKSKYLGFSEIANLLAKKFSFPGIGKDVTISGNGVIAMKFSSSDFSQTVKLINDETNQKNVVIDLEYDQSTLHPKLALTKLSYTVEALVNCFTNFYGKETALQIEFNGISDQNLLELFGDNRQYASQFSFNGANGKITFKGSYSVPRSNIISESLLVFSNPLKDNSGNIIPFETGTGKTFTANGGITVEEDAILVLGEDGESYL